MNCLITYIKGETIVKTIKVMCAVILCSLIAILLLACNSDNTTESPNTSVSADTTAVVDYTTSVDEEVIEYILTSDITKYSVIRPENSSTALVDVTAAFYREIKAIYGDKIRLKDDFIIPGNVHYSASEFEILVGNTNREETAEFMEQLRVNDYGYAVVGKKIVIAGGSDSATALAVEKFLQDIIRVKKDSEEVFISSEESFLFKATYDIDKLFVGEANISSYAIVYKYMGTHGERELAQSLRETICRATGYNLPVVSDKEDIAHANEILIGQTNRDVGDLYSKQVGENGYYIGISGNNVVIWGASSFATMTAVNEFAKKIVGNADSVTLEISETIGAIQDGIELRAMSFNVWVGSRSDARDERVIQMVLDYMPDVIGFQETGSSWMSTLIKRLGAYYNYVGEGRDGGSSGEYNPIFYRKDKFTLLESGTYWLSDTPDKVSKFSESSLNRIYTYAKLKRNSDGAEFLHINTHFDHKSSVAREKQAEVLVDFINKNDNIPMIITGDFNCESNSTEYKTIMSSSVVSSSTVAEKKKSGATFHNYGSSSKIIDFIFVDPIKVHVLNYAVCNEKINGDYASDHHPIYMDFYILK